MKTSIIICAKNEALTIGEVIKKTKGYTDDFLVIDGHSKDETRQIAKKMDCRVFLDDGKGKGDGKGSG